MRWPRFAASIALLAAAVVVLVLPAGSAPATASDSSAVTVKGSGRFSGLSVTVSQTTHLINQVVGVSWSGGTQTAPVVGNFANNYLQIMQCWGDDSGPERDHCQFGANTGDTRGGLWATSRQVTYGSSLVDPLETIHQDPGSLSPKSVPFTSVDGTTTDTAPNQFFDAYSTNEIDFARTHADGTGQEYFQVQTSREAPGLGCGTRLKKGGVQDCWLVVVPRDNTEVDGTTSRQQLDSSPLSASNWANRLQVRLHFDPVGLACPIGTPERRLVGQESVSDAVSRWQPALCEATGSIFGFSQIADLLGRQQVFQDDPWLSFVSEPVDPTTAGDKKLVYAPTAVSGVGIAFNIDRVPAYGAPADVTEKSGTRIEKLNLTPRLVAKLLTQSYKGASLDPSKLGNNPGNLTRDPEFLALNPDFKDLDIRGLWSITVPAGETDAYAELWRWIAADDRARVFIDGDPDPWGMVVNPAYKGMDLDRGDFPISDLACRSGGGVTPDLCPLDYLAYAPDMHTGGQAAAAGQTLSRAVYSLDSGGGFKVSPPQLSGSRAVLALVDTATAARYSLPMASLQTSSSTFVAPDDASLELGLAAMQPSAVDGVLSANPTPDDDNAYPLTHITYGLTAPDALSKDESTAYGRFLTYVATDGQVPGVGEGKLPPGYVPLSDDLQKQTLALGKQLAASGESESPSPTPSPSDSASPDNGGTGGNNGGTTPVVQPPPGGDPSTGPSPSASPTDQTPVVSASYPTPSAPVGPQRALLAGLFVAAALLLAARPLIGRLGGSHE